MKLNTTNIFIFYAYSFIWGIINIFKPRKNISPECFCINGKWVILWTNNAFSRLKIFTRLILSSVSMMHFISFSTKWESYKLMSKTNTKNTFLCLYSFFYLLYCFCIFSWFSWSFGNKKSIKLQSFIHKRLIIGNSDNRCIIGE